MLSPSQAVTSHAMKTSIPNQVLPRLGLGMAALGRPGYINLERNVIFGSSDTRPVDKMQKQADLVLDALFANTEGPPWIDCARSYGLSEKFVGDYLRRNNIKPDDVYVSSKWCVSPQFSDLHVNNALPQTIDSSRFI